MVLDHVPNDISVVAGIITEEFQTPLSHVNVLAQNRGTPNMGLRNAIDQPDAAALEGKWVALTVGAFDWDIHEVTQAEADAWWEAHKPAPRDAADAEPDGHRPARHRGRGGRGRRGVKLRTPSRTAILAFGAKAANYSSCANTPGVPIRKAFAIPVFYYDQFMKQNGFFDRVDALLADPTFSDTTGGARRQARPAARRHHGGARRRRVLRPC